MVIYNNKKVLFFRRISFSGWRDYTNNWFDGAKYFRLRMYVTSQSHRETVKQAITVSFN